MPSLPAAASDFLSLAVLSLIGASLVATPTTTANAQEPARHIAAPISHSATASVPQAAIAPGYWHTDGAQILDSANNPVRIASVNWYGFETINQVLGGLNVQDYHTILATIKSNGYNAIRMPFSNQMVENPIIPGVGFYGSNGPINSDLAGLTSLQIMDKVIAAAGADGLSIILDDHRSEAGGTAEANGLWYTAQYPDSSWIYDWTFLAQRYVNNPTVIGMDLRNEPHHVGTGGACWGCGTLANDWRLAASRGGNAILAVNPSLLIFVEGTDCSAATACTWWGGNLHGVLAYPVTLNTPNRLVYAPHEYGPDLAQQIWFNSTTSAASLETVWFANWGFLSQRNEVPVWIGEFGTSNNPSDLQGTTPGSQGQWFQLFTEYLQANPNLSWSYWAVNGEDSLALLDTNYSAPASALKQQILAGIQAPAVPKPGFGISASSSALSVTTGSSAPATVTVSPIDGFTGRVGFYAVGLPAGATATFASAPTATSTPLTITAAATTAPGTYSVAVVGYSGSMTAEAPIALTIAAPVAPSFTLAPATPTVSVTQSATAPMYTSDTIAITLAGGFTGNVTFTAAGLPAGVTAAFAPNPIASTAISPETITLTAATTAAPGTYPITITGTSGSLTASTTVSLTIAATPITPTIACHIGYTVGNQYTGGFQAAVVLYNTGTTAITNWTLTWTFANGQTVTQLWNGTETQTGPAVTVSSLSYNGSIPAGGNYSAMGFLATWNNTTNAIPTNFTLNGTPCK